MSRRIRRLRLQVYPRVGGGTLGLAGLAAGLRGLSPRGRGNPATGSYRPAGNGSIPAWAGEPSPLSPLSPLSPVYPRVGGGTVPPAPAARPETGSIPAWAGEPAWVHAVGPDSGVYPRVGGGTRLLSEAIVLVGGLSPRGRGNHLARQSDGFLLGSIPAWAGEPLVIIHSLTPDAVYPRVGGGTAPRPPDLISESGLSPRGRGNLARPV